MHILITGGAGFIGTHLTHALLERGDRVSVLDNLSTGSIENIKPLTRHPLYTFAIDDLSNALVLDRLASQADAIVHLAAAVGVQLVVERPTETIETNVLGTHAVLKAAQRYRCRTLIASTSEVYGKGVKLLDLPDQTAGEIYNIGSSQEVTIEQLAQTVIERTGSASAVQYISYSEAYAPGFEDMRRRVPDTAKIHAAIGWQPKHDLHQILDDVIEYERARL